MSDLKPCPFCGEMPEYVETFDGWHRIDCGNRNCTLVVYTLEQSSRDEAIAKWNTRQEPSR